MAPPHALPNPRIHSRAHLRATMRTTVACSTCAWACAHLCLVATSAATWRVCSGRRLEEPESSFEIAQCCKFGHESVKAIDRCGATEIQAEPNYNTP